MKQAPPLPLAMTEAGPSQSFSFQLLFNSDAYTVQQFPNFRIPPGMAVNLYPINGAKVNSFPCAIAEFPEALGNEGNFTSSARVIPPGADVQIPWALDNLNQLHVTGYLGDGLLAVLQLAQVG